MYDESSWSVYKYVLVSVWFSCIFDHISFFFIFIQNKNVSSIFGVNELSLNFVFIRYSLARAVLTKKKYSLSIELRIKYMESCYIWRVGKIIHELLFK